MGFTPSFSPIPIVNQANPAGQWWFTRTVGGVPEDAVPAMLASGYEIDWAMPGLFGAPTTYGLRKTRLEHINVVSDLLRSFTDAYNQGRQVNEMRYADILQNFTQLLAASESDFDKESSEIAGEVAVNIDTLSSLESRYDTFFDQINSDIDSLSLTLDADRQRAGNDFDAVFGRESQNLASRGFYSSALISSINAGIAERRALALNDIAEREQRLRADLLVRKNEIYVDVLRMRAGLIDSKISVADRRQEFMKYRIDERNKLAVSLFGFVERREDTYPGLGAMAQVASSLGESGSSSWRSG